MRLRKLLPSTPWEIEEGYNQWKPITSDLAQFLLKNERAPLADIAKALGEQNEEISNS